MTRRRLPPPTTTSPLREEVRRLPPHERRVLIAQLQRDLDDDTVVTAATGEWACPDAQEI